MKKQLTLVLILGLCFALKAQPLYFNWAKQTGSMGSIVGFSIVLDAFGNNYTTGQFQGTVDFDPGVAVSNLTSNGSDDVFITKLDANGNFVWVKQIGGSKEDYSYSITLDKSGNVLCYGNYSATVDFDPNFGTSTNTSIGGTDIFILKLTSSGNFIWAKQMGGKSNDLAQSITTDSEGNILTTGEFGKTADFDPGKDSFNLSAQFAVGLFVSKLDNLGNFVWAKKFESTHWNQSLSITTDLVDNIYFTGDFGDIMDFDPNSGVHNLQALWDFDVFICKLSKSGNFVWAKQFKSMETEMGFSIATDKHSNVYTTGYFMAKADFDPSIPGKHVLIAQPQSFGAFICKIDSSGTVAWAKQLGGNADTRGNTIVCDTYGNIISAGTFIGKTDFNPGVDTFYSSTNGHGAYISKLDPMGNFVWAKTFDSYDYLGVNDIALDDFGNIYSTGYFSEQSDFDPDFAKFDLTPNGPIDIFIHKLGKNSLSIIERDSKSAITIYPNPNNGLFNIAVPQFTHNGSIEIFNTIGTLVYKQMYINKLHAIELQSLPKGIYYVKVLSEIKCEATLKMIIN